MKKLLRRFFASRDMNPEEFEMTRKKFITCLILVVPALTILLAACGGGGGGGGGRTDH